MKSLRWILFLLVPVALLAAGCSSSPQASTPEQQKAFAGGPPPADYMKGVQAGADKARQSAANAAQNGAQKSGG